MILILLSSIITTYTSIQRAQQENHKELELIKESLTDENEIQEMQKRISLYKAFSQQQAIETTRQALHLENLILLNDFTAQALAITKIGRAHV